MIEFIFKLIFLIWSLTFTMDARSEIRLSIGEIQKLYFPALQRFENLNPKLVRTKVLGNQIEIQALTKGNGHIFIHDELGKRTLDIIVYSKLALDLEREVQELTEDMEGIQVKSIGHKVLIKGKILTRHDYSTLRQIEKKYENVLNIAEPLEAAHALILLPMIHVDAKVMEINRNKLRQLGFEFSQPFQAHIQFLPQFQTQADMNIFLKALEQKGYAKTLSNPKLVCKTGEEASLTSGGEIPVKLTSQNRLSVEWKPYGIILHIKPLADSLRHIATSISVEVSSIDTSQAIDGIPAFHTRKLNTSVNVTSGETIILSGLLYEERSQNTTGLSPLSSLPLLGNLFSSNQWIEKETELLIFITPTLYESNT